MPELYRPQPQRQISVRFEKHGSSNTADKGTAAAPSTTLEYFLWHRICVTRSSTFNNVQMGSADSELRHDEEERDHRQRPVEPAAARLVLDLPRVANGDLEKHGERVFVTKTPSNPTKYVTKTCSKPMQLTPFAGPATLSGKCVRECSRSSGPSSPTPRPATTPCSRSPPREAPSPGSAR